MDNEHNIKSETGKHGAASRDNDMPEDAIDLLAIIDSFFRRISGNVKLRRFLKSTAVTVFLLFLAVFTVFFVLYGVPALAEILPAHRAVVTNDAGLRKDPGYKKKISSISRDIQRYKRKYGGYTSGQSYIVINTTDNRFYLYQNKKIVREGFCSSGSYTMLQTEGDKKWIFKTPKGKYWIRGKTTNPVWRKPDWAFVEEGLPVPPKDDYSRYEYGVLGDYALSIGDGYMIHGTIYKRFLGMPVTHGCVRLNDDDLKVIYNTLNVGSKVYIF